MTVLYVVLHCRLGISMVTFWEVCLRFGLVASDDILDELSLIFSHPLVSRMFYRVYYKEYLKCILSGYVKAVF